eukprot:3515162-Pyramimonas_sp.AAC.1
MGFASTVSTYSATPRVIRRLREGKRTQRPSRSAPRLITIGSTAGSRDRSDYQSHERSRNRSQYTTHAIDDMIDRSISRSI